MELNDEIFGGQLEILGVVAQEALRVDRARQRLVVAVLERLQELLADARVGRGLLERDALLLTLRPKRLAEPRYR
ncbi:MAG: hypothetical protein M3O80_03175 [Chloroflexota bacterium]|nr:hypothetical protein [Chloroflexota bacterium]